MSMAILVEVEMMTMQQQQPARRGFTKFDRTDVISYVNAAAWDPQPQSSA